MNPSQSESFWKRLLQDDMQKMRTPHLPIVTNGLRRSRNQPQSNLAVHPQVPLAQPTLSLQLLQGMKANKESAFEWNQHLEGQLFQIHSQIGNRWSTIAARLSCPNDNSVKNKFYSTIRRGFRKLNKYITQIKRRRSASHLSCNKLIKGEFIVKVTAVADKTYEDKYEVKPIAVDLSQEIQRELIELANNSTEYQENPHSTYHFEESLLSKIKEFNRNCKKRKGKRKNPKSKESSDEEESPDSKPALQKFEQEEKDEVAITHKEKPSEKQFKNKEVQFDDALLMQEGDQEQNQLVLSIGQSQLIKAPLGFYTDCSPKFQFNHAFQQRAKINFAKKSMQVSKNSSFYNMSNKQGAQENNKFIQNIPSVTQQSLINSADIKRQLEAQGKSSESLNLFASKNLYLSNSTQLSLSSHFRN